MKKKETKIETTIHVNNGKYARLLLSPSDRCIRMACILCEIASASENFDVCVCVNEGESKMKEPTTTTSTTTLSKEQP